MKNNDIIKIEKFYLYATLIIIFIVYKKNKNT